MLAYKLRSQVVESLSLLCVYFLDEGAAGWLPFAVRVTMDYLPPLPRGEVPLREAAPLPKVPRHRTGEMPQDSSVWEVSGQAFAEFCRIGFDVMRVLAASLERQTYITLFSFAMSVFFALQHELAIAAVDNIIFLSLRFSVFQRTRWAETEVRVDFLRLIDE